MSPYEWVSGLNAHLPQDISVRSAERMAENFHARYSARGKLYEYRILNRAERSALERTRAWHVRGRLDVEAMRDAAGSLVGRHDFSSFQGSPTDEKDPICEVRLLEISQEHAVTRVEVQADRFLKQMVRAMVGTLVEVGRGKRSSQAVKEVLGAKGRRARG